MPTDQNLVSAAPTKKFFISVLVKDIALLDAIVELVDNSVDAARTKLGVASLSNVHIDLTFDANQFSISDNSGGISIEQARENAFRFGRSETSTPTPGTVGEFGVGMKRALFKLGRYFDVSSQTVNENFSILVDVDEWELADGNQPNAWSFKFSETGSNESQAPAGTQVKVTRLYPYVSQELGSAAFLARLTNTLKQAHAQSLVQSLQITVNNIPILAKEAYLLSSDELKPIFKSQSIQIDGKTVNFRIIAGVSEPSLQDAGWYIYCNGRQIERAEKTEKTGWNTELEGGRTPRPHWQFRRFRGYIFFDSEAHDVLPWNTTKTSLDVESPAYRRVLPEITIALKQVIAFLNSLDSESTEPGPLTSLVDDARPQKILELEARDTFIYEATVRPAASPRPVRISYTKSADEVARVKEAIGANSFKEIGEKTFDYYMQNEGLDG